MPVVGDWSSTGLVSGKLGILHKKGTVGLNEGVEESFEAETQTSMSSVNVYQEKAFYSQDHLGNPDAFQGIKASQSIPEHPRYPPKATSKQSKHSKCYLDCP